MDMTAYWLNFKKKRAGEGVQSKTCDAVVYPGGKNHHSANFIFFDFAKRAGHVCRGGAAKRKRENAKFSL